MTRIFFAICICIIVLQNACTPKPNEVAGDDTSGVKITVSNPLDRWRRDVVISIPVGELQNAMDGTSDFRVTRDGVGIPSERCGNAADGVTVLIDSIAPSATVELRVHPAQSTQEQIKKRTQAELSHKVGGEWKNREYIGGTFRNVDYLRVPPQHKDHSWYLRYEGPGWESDKVGYRLYLDQRNAIDVFGKVTDNMVLQKIGHDNFDSYHEMQPWGMDIMKVGKSLGIGSIGVLDNGMAMRVERTDSVECRIACDGNLSSSVATTYYGWKILGGSTDLASTLKINAGSRLTRQDLAFNHATEGICTGIVRDTAAVFLSDQGNANAWAYIATYGKQSLNNDNLGLVVFYDPARVEKVARDEFSHIVQFKKDEHVVYYFAAAWSGEPDGVAKDLTAFQEYVRVTAEDLANPVKVSVAK